MAGYFDKSVLKPEGSIVSGIAVAGLVYSIYSLDLGPVSNVQMTDPNHPALETSRKKAGYTAFIAVAVMTLLTRDGNVGMLGFASIIAMEAHYRHAIMADSITGIMQPPSPTKYTPAENVVPLPVQGPAYADFGTGY
jgi:hypothetical protein